MAFMSLLFEAPLGFLHCNGVAKMPVEEPDQNTQTPDKNIQKEEIFEPDSWENLLEGWLIHVKKQNKKHQECVREFEKRYWRISIPASALSAIAALPIVATLAEGPEPSIWLRIIASVLVIAAAAFVAIQNVGKFGEEAEKHRAAEFNYKDVMRQIETVFASGKADEPGAKSIGERLRVVDAEAPRILADIDVAVEERYKKRRVVHDLVKEHGCHDVHRLSGGLEAGKSRGSNDSQS
jgi:hypothetical protein